jgi:PDZ domain
MNCFIICLSLNLNIFYHYQVAKLKGFFMRQNNQFSLIKNKTQARVLGADTQKFGQKYKTKWMLLTLLGLGFALLATQLLAAENLYEKNYKAQNSGGLVSLQANPDTKMFVSNHNDTDNITMLEDGFDMMGSSGFEGSLTAPELALQHAKAIKADTVLVYSKYGNTKLPGAKIEVYKEAVKAGKDLTEKDMVEDTTNYVYYASYWAKLPQPLLGVHIIKLAKKESQEAEKAVEEDGLKILAVIKNSPAAKAGLVRGDVLMKIADVNLNKPEELSNIVRQKQGQNVVIEYEREGVKVATKAQINAKK